jgi:hypothetical protein
VNERPSEESRDPGEAVRAVDDPTSRLLREVTGESRFPWVPAAVAVLLVLWIASMPRLMNERPGPAETGWMNDALVPTSVAPAGSALARALTRASWTWQGVTPDLARPLTERERLVVRLPAAAAGAASLLVFFLLARLVAGSASALLAACLLAIAHPWIQAGTSAIPLVAGEMLVLLGVTWALGLHARHREVELAAVTALRVGVAGAFLGVGLLLAPATFASFVTTLLLWFVLGVRRSSSDATTLPVESPRRTIALAVAGTLVLLGAGLAAGLAAERLAGGDPRTAFVPLPPADPGVWSDLHRRLLSPGPLTDRLLLAALLVTAVVRGVERWGGRPWKAAGLLPWAYLGVHFWLAGKEARAAGGAFVMPLTIAPLLVLGIGWIVLRGLSPGRARRQEYGFAVTWLLASVLLAPFVPGGHPHDPALAAAVSVLPPVLLVAARGARSLWEAEGSDLARAAILGIAYLPVAQFGADALGVWLGGPRSLDLALNAIRAAMPTLLLAAAGVGALAVVLTVRPEKRAAPAEEAPHHPGRRGRRGGRPGRRGRHGRYGRRGPEGGDRRRPS